MLLASSPPSSFSSFSHQPFGTLLAASDDLSAALTAPAPYQTFEPVVNVPALSAFAFVTVVFGLLQLRINRVQTAAERRKAALESLRVVKSLQLGADDFDNLERVRRGGDFEIMGVQHRDYPIYGIQFHPESFATEGGKELIKNFLFAA